MSIRIFIKLNVKHAYHWLCIHKDDEWKTAFCTLLELFEYMIMSFNLVNTSAAFQSYINKIFHEYLDVFMIVYLNDIVIYSSYKENYKDYIYKIFEILTKVGFYIKLSKY